MPTTRTAPNAKTPAKVTLDDLSPADRERLLADALAAQSARDATDDELAARRRQVAIAALMEERDHARGCPAGRVEAFAATKPARPNEGIPAQPVSVVRCIDCGESVVIAQPYDQTIASIIAATAEEDDE